MASRRGNGASTWPMEEWEEFDALTSVAALHEVETGLDSFAYPPPGELPRPWIPGLLGIVSSSPLSALSKSTEARRADRLSARWAEVKSHPVYKRLQKDADYRLALRTFMGRQNRKDPGKYGEPYATLRFMNIIAGIVTHQAAVPDVKVKYASKAIKASALNSAKNLLVGLDSGVRLNRWPDDAALKKLLTSLVDKLAADVAGGTRKRRTDSQTSQRWYLDGLIGQLITTFGDASPTIVLRVGAMMGYQVDQSTVERRIETVVARKVAEAADHPVIDTLGKLGGLLY